MVFEYVKGATITGTAQPGARVEVQLNVTSGDTTRTYYSATKADASGAYSFTVPYPTGASGDIRTGSDYSITSGATTVKVQVPEGAVAEGRTITAGGM
jgi:dolichyl-diphosphooligosaccharide--protein glycosyltransferase